MNSMTRRDMLRWSAFVAGSLCAGSSLSADDQKPLKLLFFTKSSSFEHSVIARKGKPLAYAEKILADLGTPRGFDIAASKDGGLFSTDYLAGFDAFVFCSQGDLSIAGLDKQPPISPEGKQALLDAVAAGKGFVGIHCATDTYRTGNDTIDPYIAMLGGEFIKHDAQQQALTHVIDPKFPGAPAKDFTIKEEWYAMKKFAADLHMILQQETAGMTGDIYQRPPYPSTWAKMHGKGKVFYTSMGHREDTWKNPMFVDLLMGGISWVTGKATAEIPANIGSAK